MGKIKLTIENKVALSNLGRSCNLSREELTNGIIQLYIMEYGKERNILKKIKDLHPILNVIDTRVSIKYFMLYQLISMISFIGILMVIMYK